MTTPDQAKCGTYAAYQAHLKRGETPDAACKKARADYMRAYRLATDHKASRRDARTMHRALTRLRDAHPDEYRVYLLTERLAERKGSR